MGCRMRNGSGQRHRVRGFTYLGVLFGIALIGIGLAAAGQIWSASLQRQREAQLRWVLEQYRLAIASYYESSPGSVKRYPQSIEDLLADQRFITIRRHLRQPYLNPVTNKNDWVLVRSQDQGIAAIQASSKGAIDAARP